MTESKKYLTKEEVDAQTMLYFNFIDKLNEKTNHYILSSIISTNIHNRINEEKERDITDVCLQRLVTEIKEEIVKFCKTIDQQLEEALKDNSL